MTNSGAKKFQILVVDDMKVNYMFIAKILAPHDFECHFEGVPENVLSVAQQIAPDAILLDFEMPGMSGPDVCQALKTDSITAEIPVLFVTSQTGEAELSRAFESGADDYVLKPVREKELLARLNRSLLTRDLKAGLISRFEDQSMITRILSHDINNLLTIAQSGVTGLNRILEPICPSEKSADMAKFNKRLTESLRRIGSLIANVRQLQSIEDEKLVLTMSPVSLASALKELKSQFTEKLESKQLQFEIHVTGEGLILAEEQALLDSVLSNLLSNAIKFSQTGKIITASVHEDSDFIYLEFKDQGIGMDQDLASKIFSKSERTSRAGTHQEKGTGFGMPIVKRYMDLFQGVITVDSKSIEDFPNDSGTTFTLMFKKP